MVSAPWRDPGVQGSLLLTPTENEEAPPRTSVAALPCPVTNTTTAQPRSAPLEAITWRYQSYERLGVRLRVPDPASSRSTWTKP